MKDGKTQACGEEGFFLRWSRRKLERARDEATQPAAMSHAPEEEPTLGDDDVPPLETLGESSDYSVFLSPAVSDELCRLALRRLFHSPVFNIRDSLDDYDEDYGELAALGTLVPEEMRRRLTGAAERMMEKETADTKGPEASSPEKSRQYVAREAVVSSEKERG